MRARRSGESGMALVLTLAAVLFLSIVGWAVLGTGRTDARLARNAAETARLTALADGAINIAILHLLSSDEEAPTADGTPRPVTVDGQTVAVSVRDEAGRIDLNDAPADTLRGVWVAQGIDPDTAQALADRIVRWRGTRGRGTVTSTADDTVPGQAYGPRRGRLETIDEARLVAGMRAFDKAAPLLTVYAQAPVVNVSVAPADVLRALPTLDDARIADILEQRASDSAVQEARQPGSSVGRALTIAAHAVGPRGVQITRTATIRITGFGNQPFWIYVWN